jgi:spore germination protein GerM
MRRRAAALALLLCATATACGIPADESPRAVTDRAMPEELDDATDSGNGQRTRTVIFFSRFDDDRGDILVPTEREVPTGGPSGEPTPGTVLEALFAGAEDDSEAGERLVTKVPADTDLASQPQLAADGTLTIDLNSAISGVQSDGAQLAYGQMVCTVTSLERVDQVLFTVDGQPTWPPTGEGVSSDGPLTCTSYATLLGDDADAADAGGDDEEAATSAASGLG